MQDRNLNITHKDIMHVSAKCQIIYDSCLFCFFLTFTAGSLQLFIGRFFHGGLWLDDYKMLPANAQLILTDF